MRGRMFWGFLPFFPSISPHYEKKDGVQFAALSVDSNLRCIRGKKINKKRLNSECRKTEWGEQRGLDFVILPGLCAVLAPLTAIGNKAREHVWFLLLLYYDFFFHPAVFYYFLWCRNALWSERGISLEFSWKGRKSPCEKVLQRCKRCLSIAAGLLSLAMKVVYLGEWQTANLR